MEGMDGVGALGWMLAASLIAALASVVLTLRYAAPPPQPAPPPKPPAPPPAAPPRRPEPPEPIGDVVEAKIQAIREVIEQGQAMSPDHVIAILGVDIVATVRGYETQVRRFNEEISRYINDVKGSK